MEASEAAKLIRDVDDLDHPGRTARLVELTALLPTDGVIGFSGQAAAWLFEDVKATWLYGCFTSTVLTAHAFCVLQLAGAIRMLPDDRNRPDVATSLEQLAVVAVECEVIDVSAQARLVQLHDRALAYTSANLYEYEARLEAHLLESEIVSADDPLLIDARYAVTTAIDLVHHRHE
jgi:hypothetical protein